MSQYGGIIYLGRDASVKFDAFQDDLFTPQGTSYTGGSDLATGDWTAKRIAKDGANDAALTATVTARDTRGGYEVALLASSGHTDTPGKLELVFEAAGTQPVHVVCDVVRPTIRRV